ncbi:Ig-like domain-containing protein [Porphyromonas uenonis]|uniref:Ig-like domain-containing protein n=1 Tax=Porphyromonas uenonis TaxID=281920 RepID=UPI002672A001|nr:Ig-like domain-containing protein [Porphyromonas uenonis]
MKKQIIQRLSMLLVLLFGAIFSGMAVNRLQIETAGIEPGETVAVPISLENDQTFYGFQLDIAFPEGLDAVQKNGNADVILSSRLDNSFQLVTNKLADGKLRILAFSTSHQAITGNSGALFYINVSAAEDFSGGQLSATNIRMVGEGDRDVVLPDLTVELGTEHNNHFYIQDFKIAVGETKTVSLILDNETEFTAFQTDLYLPEGISIVPNSAKMTSRGYASHSISMKSFSDGRTRIACLSPNSDAFRGNRGVLLTIDFTANKDAAETSKIQMKNQTFVTPHVKEYKLPNSECTVTTERALVESITLEPTSLVLIEENSQQLTPTVLPTFASTKDLKWSSSAPDIATVSATGLVTALKSGDCVITAAAVDGSGVTATCPVTVTENPVTSVTLNRSTATLKATETVQLSGSVLPANASNKDLVWTTNDEHIATVSESGLVTAVAVGEVTITATSQSTPDISATCQVSVVPTPVASITLSQTSVSLKATETVSLTATVAPETATVKDVTWTSDNPKVATVDENGVITAVTAGEAVITVTATDGSGVFNTVKVQVEPIYAESITIVAEGSTTLRDGETVQLRAVFVPENTTDKRVTWDAGTEINSTIDENGLFTAGSVPRLVGVVARSIGTPGVSGSIEINVVETPVESVEITSEPLVLLPGESKEVTVSVNPSTATDKTITWSVSDESIIKLQKFDSSVAVINAIAPGQAYLYAKASNGVNTSLMVTVNTIPVSEIILSKQELRLNVSETYQFEANVLPANANNKAIRWESSNAEIGTVDETGFFTAIAPGETVITCYATDESGVSTQCQTVVIQPVTSIMLNEHKLELEKDKSIQLVATIEPVNATDKRVTWSSSEPEIVSVNEAGVIKALKEGEAIITVATLDGSLLDDKCKVTVSINSGIEKITIDDIKVSVNGNTIVVELESSLIPVRLYMINGTEIPATSRINKQVFFSDLDAGYYIISLGKRALKIRV